MIIDIGNIIIDKISSLPWLDKYTGVVKVITYAQPTDDGKVFKKVFPVACNTEPSQCTSESKYLEFCPDSKKKSVLFLEEKPLRFVKRDGDIFYFQASYDLIAWLNIPKLGESQCSISSMALLSILSVLPIAPFNDGNYQRIMINPLGQEPKTRNPFAKYSFDESINQFLMYPYDYFVLPVNVDFAINRKCINQWDPGAPLTCE